jgi:flagellar biosynthetic protein FliO
VALVAKYKKLVLFLILAWWIAGYCIAEPNSPENTESPVSQTQTKDNSGSFLQMDPNSPWNLSQSADNKQLFSSAAKAIIIVIILCVAIIFISKKLLPKISNLSGRRIQIIETVHLTQRKSLHLVKVDDRQLLIGSTNENITKLAELTDVLNNSFESHIRDIEETNDQPKE